MTHRFRQVRSASVIILIIMVQSASSSCWSGFIRGIKSAAAVQGISSVKFVTMNLNSCVCTAEEHF